MFTGIISDVGEIVSVAAREAGVRLRVACGYDCGTIDLGASIACSGVCLTVVAREAAGGRCLFDVDASSETLACTTLGQWSEGDRINLERALRAGDELGGHIVSGHVDGVATITGRADEDDMARFTFEVPDELSRFIAAKGSVALDGTSLTVNGVDGRTFSVMLIPHSLQVTAWDEKSVGDTVNLEVDVFARYLDRLDSCRRGEG
ncbi:MAG TPA: riboflavin synthase [Afifellaceae bacterium]|nr:riboflavin synthase [Afifellaceae bacterium]